MADVRVQAAEHIRTRAKTAGVLFAVCCGAMVGAELFLWATAFRDANIYALTAALFGLIPTIVAGLFSSIFLTWRA